MFHLKFRPVRRVKQDAEITGVCAGIAYGMGVHVQVIRCLVLLAIFFHPAVILVYFLAGCLMPKWIEAPKDYLEVAHKPL